MAHYLMIALCRDEGQSSCRKLQVPAANDLDSRNSPAQRGIHFRRRANLIHDPYLASERHLLSTPKVHHSHNSKRIISSSQFGKNVERRIFRVPNCMRGVPLPEPYYFWLLPGSSSSRETSPNGGIMTYSAYVCAFVTCFSCPSICFAFLLCVLRRFSPLAIEEWTPPILLNVVVEITELRSDELKELMNALALYSRILNAKISRARHLCIARGDPGHRDRPRVHIDAHTGANLRFGSSHSHSRETICATTYSSCTISPNTLEVSALPSGLVESKNGEEEGKVHTTWKDSEYPTSELQTSGFRLSPKEDNDIGWMARGAIFFRPNKFNDEEVPNAKRTFVALPNEQKLIPVPLCQSLFELR
ncbi:uncharacterized protein FOMMEDRAFT_155980 [Fomitiporia mediterranea MF3/22]|uniref:uncharacterized protein n=1 Tax=Fomitiporia mediterranea (strain MF3/22) TaxID=694068 RepID=UPI0004409A11|nr:uncharacterized protein FOMMEDRAFT_155980 [Fomitiporia mediterranea MF3/22]EJD02653.1 hypothetical protein FOMMEDRAFT_155980 [Fomitiporia mediterranea MF3/22]